MGVGFQKFQNIFVIKLINTKYVIWSSSRLSGLSAREYGYRHTCEHFIRAAFWDKGIT